ncbi:Hypothetical_protein [Hexamita inflata]|uniref:Hypothetical_protein n=1 Tax=Hexamita inflata TaxID=28002 RepID=A0ABP1GFW8_9EUKA
MYLLENEFVKVCVPILQAINYSFNGQNDKQIVFNDVFQSIESLDEQQYAEFWNTLSMIHQCDMQQIYVNYLNLQHQQQVTRRKRITDKVIKSKLLIRTALIQVCLDFNKPITNSCGDKDLCQHVNQIVDKDTSQQFWNKVQSLIPQKSKKQIYDFYHTSFSKALFDENINITDKLLIKRISEQYKDAKPAEQAQIFMNLTGKNILKRNVVMQFVNMHKKIKKQIKEKDRVDIIKNE